MRSVFIWQSGNSRRDKDIVHSFLHWSDKSPVKHKAANSLSFFPLSLRAFVVKKRTY